MRWSTRWASLREAAVRVCSTNDVPASIASDVLSRALPSDSHSRGDQGGKPPTGGSSSSTSTAATTAFETRFSSAPSSTISFVRIAQHRSRSGSAHATVPVAPTCPCEAAPSQAKPTSASKHRRGLKRSEEVRSPLAIKPRVKPIHKRPTGTGDVRLVAHEGTLAAELPEEVPDEAVLQPPAQTPRRSRHRGGVLVRGHRLHGGGAPHSPPVV